MRASGKSHTSERTGGLRLLRSVEAGMLVMWDRGFHSFEMLLATLARGSDYLGRLPAHVHPQVVRRLPDGSCLAYLTPSDYQARKAGARVLVRLVEYTIADPQLPRVAQRADPVG
jgi:hypothetical protein